MNNIICETIDVRDLTLDTTELSGRLRTPAPLDSEVIRDCIARVSEVCRPRYCYAKTSVSADVLGECQLDFMAINSVSLAKALADCSSAYVAAVTLGIEVDRLIARLAITSKAKSFIADGVASALAEAAMEQVNGLLPSQCLKERYSVGYGDFVLSYQAHVLDFLKADKLLGIKLSESYIMTPRKSVTAVIGVKK